MATGVFATILVLISLVGFAGAAGRSLALISIYYFCLWVSLLAMLGLGAYYLDAIVRNIDSTAVPRAMYVAAYALVFIFILGKSFLTPLSPSHSS
jgi:Kef-type K+ transport system membrane component KefB